MTDADSPVAGRWRPLSWLSLVLVLLFVSLGLTGHDPWKQDEAYSFGMILNMVQEGDWVVPRLADDPFMEKPPVYYWTAAGLVQAFDGWLPAHDAARLATGLYLLVTLLATALSAHLVWRPPAGAVAALLWLSTLVVVQQGHYLITDTALAAGMAVGLLGLLVLPRRWLAGGLLLGSGAGLAFLSKGLLGPGILGLTALLLPLLPAWRSGVYVKALAVALLAAAPWVLIWPAMLYLRDPALFMLWFWDNNVGRYFGGVELGPPAGSGFWLRTFPWATFPAAPVALWALWLWRREFGRALAGDGRLPAVVLLSLIGWAVLFLAHTARDLYALPLIAPLAVIAAGGATRLPPLISAASYWLSLLLFGLAGLLLWFLWTVGAVTGSAPDWALIGKHLPLAHDFSRPAAAVGLALLLTGAWLLLVVRLRPPRRGAPLAWPAGIVMLWGLVALLHFPWIDQAKSYREVFQELRAALPDDFDCLSDLTEPETVRLRESERGLLHYFAGVKIQHATAAADVDCDFILLEVQRRRHPDGISLGDDWALIWQGQRPTDRRDRFVLFARRGAKSADSAAAAPRL